MTQTIGDASGVEDHEDHVPSVRGKVRTAGEDPGAHQREQVFFPHGYSSNRDHVRLFRHEIHTDNSAWLHSEESHIHGATKVPEVRYMIHMQLKVHLLSSRCRVNSETHGF